uniref:Peptidase_M23 domain-containing protein n=1 Tax=Strongyloides papillosus TaxID=174720 RepID=A0A0N5B1Y3_STREA
MLTRIFKRQTSTKEAPERAAFEGAFGSMKRSWLAEQKAAKGFSPEEQAQISFKQKNELQKLVKLFGLGNEPFISEYSVPLLTEQDIEIELPAHERELDDILRKEIGKIVFYLRNFSITGVERYIDTIEKALLSLGKNISRTKVLDNLASGYAPTLLSRENGMARSYYEQVLHNKDPATQLSLTEILREMVELMTLDGHRARMGTSIKPPRQHNMAIGTFIKNFENYILRIDGIRMDSLEMSENAPLNNERRRQFVNGLDNALRILVTQPAYQAQWHAFTQSYIDGFARLYPHRPLFENRSFKKHSSRNRFTHDNKNSHYGTRRPPPNDGHSKHTFTNSKLSENKPAYTPTFLKTNKPNLGNNKSGSFDNKRRFNNFKNKNKKPSHFHKINSIETTLQQQSEALNSLTRRLSLFDIPKTTLGLLAIFTLISPALGWQCETLPPFFPSIYIQNDYSMSKFSVIETSLQEEICIPVKYQPAYMLGNIIIDRDPASHKETLVSTYPQGTCQQIEVYSNHTTGDLFLVKRSESGPGDHDFMMIMSIYTYHHAFNLSCPIETEIEKRLPVGKRVPDSPVHKKRKRKPSSTNGSDNECPVLPDQPAATKAREEKLLSDIMSLEKEKRTLVDQYGTLNTHYKETMAALETVKDNNKATTEQLAQARIDITNLEATIKNTKRQLTEAYQEIDEAKQNMENQKQQHLGSQNAALQLQELHQDQLSRLRDSHAKNIETLTDEHEKSLKKRKGEIGKAT